LIRYFNRSSTTHSRRRVLALLIAVALGVALAGAATASGTPHAAAGNLVAQARAFVAAHEGPLTKWWGPTTPVKPEPGKKIMILSCNQATACSGTTATAAAAARKLGWSVQIVDGKGDPATYNAAIHNAVVAGVNGIIDVAIPDSLIVPSLLFAKQHHVPVVNGSSTTDHQPGVSANTPVPWLLRGRLAADYIIASTNGHANVVLIRDNEFPGIKAMYDLIDRLLTACSGCHVLQQINLTSVDITGPTLTQTTTSALERYGSQLQWFILPYDAADALVVPALQSANRLDVKVVSFDGGAQEEKYCHAGQGIAGSIVDVIPYIGWESADALDRIFAGQTNVTEPPEPFFLLTRKTCPSGVAGATLEKFNYQGEFEKLWGVKK
jgi:ribose transport system substrate-binding protein